MVILNLKSVENALTRLFGEIVNPCLGARSERSLAHGCGLERTHDYRRPGDGDQNTMDVRLAYLQLGNLEANGFVLQGGRIDMNYGNNRLVGSSWWTNVSRSYDGVRAIYQQGRLRVDTFATSVVIVRDGVVEHHLQGNNLDGLPPRTTSFHTPHSTYIDSGTCGRASPFRI